MEFYNSKQDIKVLDSLNTLNKLLTACAKSYDLNGLSKADTICLSKDGIVAEHCRHVNYRLCQHMCPKEKN